MYYTGIDPLTGKKVYTATDYHEKQLQRALLQWGNPKNADLVREALRKCGREELIGYGGDCLVKPEKTPQKIQKHTKPTTKSGNYKAAQKGKNSPRGNYDKRRPDNKKGGKKKEHR